MSLDTPHTIEAFPHRMSHHLSTSRCHEQSRYCFRNQCSHMGAHRLELWMDPVQPTSCKLTLVWDVESIWAGNLCHFRVGGAVLIKNYTSVETKVRKFHVFFPKFVFGDPKTHPNRCRCFSSSSPILLIPFSSDINPLGIKCLTLSGHASNSGFTVAQGQHYHMPTVKPELQFLRSPG